MPDPEERVCKKCGHKFRYELLTEAIGMTFVAKIAGYPFEGRPAVVSSCPKCRTVLTLESTQVATVT